MMKNLKTYRMFESSVTLTPEQIEWLDQCTRIEWNINPQTGLVDVKGGFNCFNQNLSDLKGVRFGVVGVYFNCGSNQLTSLEGAPQEVLGDFICSNNQLTSLVGAPQVVGGDFDCRNNQLSSLEGAPQVVGRNFICRENQLTSLEGLPQKISGSFVCGDNPVSRGILENIFSLMRSGGSNRYQESLRILWRRIPLEDKILLWRPEFEWIVGEERRKLDALRAYQGIKGML